MVIYYRIYKSWDGGYRTAYIETTNDKVSASSPALSFMIGWKIEKVRERVMKHGFKIAKRQNGSRNTTFVTKRPSKAERLKMKTNPI